MEHIQVFNSGIVIQDPQGGHSAHLFELLEDNKLNSVIPEHTHCTGCGHGISIINLNDGAELYMGMCPGR